jgi:hypothetical protein
VSPADCADALVKVWDKAVSAEAISLMTRGSQKTVALPVLSVTGGNGKVSVVLDGSQLGEEFFTGKQQMSVVVIISDGNNERTSEYVAMVPNSINSIIEIIEIESVIINAEKTRIVVGESLQLSASIMPDNATDKSVSWSSSNEEVAIVDDNGRVIGVNEGTTVITATAGTKTAICTITVTPIGDYLAFTASEPSTIAYSYSGPKGILEYSFDTIEWKSWVNYLELTPNKTIYVRGKGWASWRDGYLRFRMTGKIAASGNILSLVYYDDFENQLSIWNRAYFGTMFSDCTSLTQAPKLPATILSEYCYEDMFSGCTGLAEAPELPAITLTTGCYSGMFRGCTGLTKAPRLPATNLAKDCYDSMFGGCTGLIQAPELPAMYLAETCYQYMFSGCTGLTEVQELPATNLARGCYFCMFWGCTNLTQVPSILPATTLAERSYYGMFGECTNLTQAPILPATNLAKECYLSMFDNCINLTQAPDLPATNLAESCYYNMFFRCSSLTRAPELPARILAKLCYYCMFNQCTSLSYIKCLATNISADHCTFGWLNYVAESGTFVKASSMTNWEWGSEGIPPSGWTVEDASE